VLEDSCLERSVLEWRSGSTSDARMAQAISDDVERVIQCSVRCTFIFEAAALQDLGLHYATDAVGGYYALAAHLRHPAHTIFDHRHYRVRMRPNDVGILVATCLGAGSG
jgi:hypothetical protein